MPLTCRLSCKMSLDNENSKDISYHANLTERIRSWDPTKSNEFCQNINTLDLLRIEQTIDDKVRDSVEIQKEDVDFLFNSLADVLLSSAKTTFGTFLPRNKT